MKITWEISTTIWAYQWDYNDIGIFGAQAHRPTSVGMVMDGGRAWSLCSEKLWLVGFDPPFHGESWLIVLNDA